MLLTTRWAKRWCKSFLIRFGRLQGDELIHAIDSVNIGVEQTLGVAAFSNSSKGTLVTPENLKEISMHRLQALSRLAVRRKLVLGVSPMHAEVAIDFWQEISRWLQKRIVRASRVEVIKGLNADAVNKALDQYRDDNGTKANMRVRR